MADEDGGSKKSGLHRIAEWIGGLTAIVLALVGLKVAVGELLKGSVFDGTPTNMAANGGDDGYVLVNDSAPEGAMTNMDVVTNASDSDVAPTPTPTSIQEPDPEATMLPIEEGPPLPTSYSKPNGVLRKLDDGGWEETDTAAGIRFTFAEVRRSEEETLLFDQSRNMYLRFPTAGGDVQWSGINPMRWIALYSVAVSAASE